MHEQTRKRKRKKKRNEKYGKEREEMRGLFFSLTAGHQRCCSWLQREKYVSVYRWGGGKEYWGDRVALESAGEGVGRGVHAEL